MRAPSHAFPNTTRTYGKADPMKMRPNYTKIPPMICAECTHALRADGTHWPRTFQYDHAPRPMSRDEVTAFALRTHLERFVPEDEGEPDT
jgi:hypothetical protein